MLTLHAYNHNKPSNCGGWIGKAQCANDTQSVLDTLGELDRRFPNMTCVLLNPGETTQTCLYSAEHGISSHAFELDFSTFPAPMPEE